MIASEVGVWVVILVVAAGTFGFRFSFIYLVERVDEIPTLAERALRYVAPAVLAALVAPSVLVVDGSIAVLGNDRLLAGLVGATVAWRTESILWTMAVGVGALLLFQQVV